MIININSWPGVGKLSVAELLQRRIGGRLLDNHAIYNVAFGLCDFGSPEFFETVRAVRRVAFNQASKIPASTPIILTSAYANTPFGRENWAAIRAMADARSTPLCNVVLDCAIEENIRRLVSPQRAPLRKLAEPQTLVAMRKKGDLIDDEVIIACASTLPNCLQSRVPTVSPNGSKNAVSFSRNDRFGSQAAELAPGCKLPVCPVSRHAAIPCQRKLRAVTGHPIEAG
ncbi:AAA family ATPase [Bradyrhizobium sp. 174]|uniref:AAA family ATPase n=1 Tax=Bradyrhizobium sp. 174 TaxID=2782645 RepID=UPI001FF838E3|nr:AAA family ATPase [Bradyrhizobium sp. 174]MCK1573902.1 hypothetical protein [Bradyrhizobium sp. 174]